MSKFKGFFWILVLSAIGAAFIFSGRIFNYFSPRINKIENTALSTAVKAVKQQFSAPPPLKLKPTIVSRPSALLPTLTVLGTIKSTNTQRNENDLPPLIRNATLDEIATIRAKDMFEKQYFAHISPIGTGAESVADDVGYDYLALGENLALGNFKNDDDLVQAWMNSPGHRANILNSHYTEIGVAVKKGIYEGDSVWIAVQVFGKPASACPKIDTSLKTSIEANDTQLKNLEAIISLKKQEIDNSQNKQEYNQKVEEYNVLVNNYNVLLGQTKLLIPNYDSLVSVYNQCIVK